ncbi:MAG: aminopeptidase [Flavobacteriales bacterium]|nr:aminopeptidase [Flavobacteriales bacterium]
MIKKLGYGIVLILLAYLGYHFKSVVYGVQQGAGQVEVLWNAQEISELMIDPDFPDSTKEKFQFIATIKFFAESRLGLTKTQNYTSFYDQNGQPILWVVTASPEFEIKAHEWKFPIAGGFPYKGFFDKERAKKEQQKFEKLGYDTELDEVNAWSTLGWFRDPILSSMLQRGSGRLADLIIHESTHATLYVKDNVSFNENLASFVGKIGAELFLKEHYGDSSAEFLSYKLKLERSKIYKDYMRSEITTLNEMYQNLDTTLAIEEKRALKKKRINEIKEGLLRINYFTDSTKARARINSFEFNNAYFSGFNTYSKTLPQFNQLLEEEFSGDLKKMIASFKEKYESL